METIKKLMITIRISAIFIILPIIVAFFEVHLKWILSLIGLLVLFILLKFIFFKDKNTVDYSRDFSVFHSYVYFIFGFMFLSFAIIATSGIIQDITQGDSISILGTLMVLGLWILGILIIYYTYQAKKEFHSRNKLKEKPKEKIKKFNINYLMAFYILATIMGFIFKIYPLTLRNIFISIFIILIIYLLSRIISLKNIKR